MIVYLVPLQAMNFRGLYALESRLLTNREAKSKPPSLQSKIHALQAHKLFGVGPKVLTPPMCAQFFKYNSASRVFAPLDTCTFTVTTDAAALNRAYFKNKKAARTTETARARAGASAGGGRDRILRDNGRWK